MTNVKSADWVCVCVCECLCVCVCGVWTSGRNDLWKLKSNQYREGLWAFSEKNSEQQIVDVQRHCRGELKRTMNQFMSGPVCNEKRVYSLLGDKVSGQSFSWPTHRQFGRARVIQRIVWPPEGLTGNRKRKWCGFWRGEFTCRTTVHITLIYLL